MLMLIFLKYYNKYSSVYKKNHQKISAVDNDEHSGHVKYSGFSLQPIVSDNKPMAKGDTTLLAFLWNVLFIDSFISIFMLFPSPPFFLVLLNLSSFHFQLLGLVISGSFWPTVISSLLKLLKFFFLVVQYMLPFTSIFNFAFIISHFSDDNPQ